MSDYVVELSGVSQFKTHVYEKPKEKSNAIIREEDNEDWKFTQIEPPPKKEPKKTDLIKISDLPKFCQPAFTTTTQLNQIQSIVFPVAFKQSRNMIVAAPTGAGKTNVALTTILR